MSVNEHALAVSLVSEVLAADQVMRHELSRTLPKGMEISHFSVLNHLAWHEGERTPAQLAEALHVTRGAMSNTLSRLDAAGYIHVRPDWDDARRKLITISPAGRRARESALSGIAPVLGNLLQDLGGDSLRDAIRVLRHMRSYIGAQAPNN